MGGWISESWFNILSAAGIIASILFGAVSLRSETKTRRVANHLILTQNHRELWSLLFEYRDLLGRILDPAADPSKEPVSVFEAFFVSMAVQHLGSAYDTMKSGLVMQPSGVAEDVRWFFSLPIPRSVWERIRSLQNQEFAEFVDEARNARSEKSAVSL